MSIPPTPTHRRSEYHFPPSGITVTLDSNENGTPRHTALAEALAKNPDRWDLKIANIPLDLMFSISDKMVAWELKEINDVWGSMSSGHLGMQARQGADLNGPCFVGILGSLEDVLGAGPRLTTRGYKSKGEQVNDAAMMRGFLADLFAAQFTPMFLSKDLTLSMGMIASMSRRWLLGGNMAEWSPRVKVQGWGEFCLNALPGIGAQKAKDLTVAGIGVQLAKEHRRMVTPADLIEVRGIGPKLANKMLDAASPREVSHRRRRARFVMPED